MMAKFKLMAVLVAAFGIGGAVYSYLKNDFDFSFGLEEDDDENV